MSEWFKDDVEAKAAREIGFAGDIVGIYSVARWTGKEMPPRTSDIPYPFAPLYRQLVCRLLDYPDADEHVRPHFLRLRRRTQVLMVCDALAAAERTRQDRSRSLADKSLELARAAWWRYEHGRGDAEPDDRNGRAPSAGDEQRAEHATRLRLERSYVERRVARMLYDGTAPSLSVAYRVLSDDLPDGALAYMTETALRRSLARRNINVSMLKEKGEDAFN